MSGLELEPSDQLRQGHQPEMHVTEQEVMAAAQLIGGETAMAVEQALPGIRFYPIYGGLHARFGSVMNAVGPSLNGSRKAFEEMLHRVAIDSDTARGYLC